MNEHYLPPIDPEIGDWDEHAISRRQALQMGFWSVTGAACLIFGGAGARFIVGPSLVDAEQQWVDLGPIGDLATGQMHRLTYTFRFADLWREEQRQGVVYVFTADGRIFNALDATCSHLGCNVHWKESDDHFACPCHKGSYSKEGEVLFGPPPQPLRRLETKVEGSILKVLV